MPCRGNQSVRVWCGPRVYEPAEGGHQSPEEVSAARRRREEVERASAYLGREFLGLLSDRDGGSDLLDLADLVHAAGDEGKVAVRKAVRVEEGREAVVSEVETNRVEHLGRY